METLVNVYLSLICTPKILTVKKFKVADFFKSHEAISMYFGRNFTSWVLEKSKFLELSLENETELSKFKLIKEAWDSEIQSDFNEKPSIPVKIFLPLLKSFMENQAYGEDKEDGLDSSGVRDIHNIFHVDLTEISPEMGVIVVNIYFLDAWCFDAYTLNTFPDSWKVGSYFFSLS